MCSHFNAVRYWVDTLNPKYGEIFASQKCPSWEDYQEGKCRKNHVNYMGLYASRQVQGTFFIKLNSEEYYDGRAFYHWLLNRLGKRVIDLVTLNF